MDVKVYQCVIQNVFTVYYTVLTESNSTEKITIPYVDYGRFEVFAEPGFSKIRKRKTNTINGFL